ncbi:hypothetical protein HG531_007630 [Fusarium graminearum]|nr:hypothetical protein HG531_007630 [Fusarium graminearum]
MAPYRINASSSLGLDAVELAGNGAIVGRELVGLGQVAHSSLLVLEVDVGKTATVESLCAVGVLDSADFEGSGSRAGSVVPGLKLDVEEG